MVFIPLESTMLTKLPLLSKQKVGLDQVMTLSQLY